MLEKKALLVGTGGIVLHDCLFAEGNKDYKWCLAEVGTNKGYINQFHLEPDGRW